MRCPHCGMEINPNLVANIPPSVNVNAQLVTKKKGPSTGCIIGIVVGFFLFIFFGGCITAIAYPQYVRSLEQAKFRKALSIADQIVVAEANYKKANGKYTNNFSNLNLSIPESSVNGKSLETYDFTYELAVPNLQIIRKENSNFNYKITASLSKKQATCEGNDMICDRFKE